MLQEKEDQGWIIDLVKKKLPNEDQDIFPLTVWEEGVTRDGDYWRVPIQPRVTPKRTYQFYEILAELEETLEEEGANILLVPVYPD
ncbi:MAG: hypothetical protein H6752_02840 [Candidatus Omnitrophica bacterium]|nr:hypothetical protein [Candidatus Omnitrophota bacterium]